MTVGYVIRQQAGQDLEEIWLYSMQQWGIRLADKYVGSLKELLLGFIVIAD